MRPWGLVVVLVLLASCGFDRDRPAPVEPDVQADLSVQLLSPRTGEVVAGGTELTVEVLARDLSGERLHGVGFVVRRSGSGGNATLDSVVQSTGAQSQAVREFVLLVPEGLPVNAQLDVFGLAFGPGLQSRVSLPQSVTVIPCAPGIPGCS